MKASELIIGNYVNTENGIKRVSTVSVDGWSMHKISEPILITEEWLIKFSFKRTNKYDFELIKNDFNFHTSSDFFHGNGFICFNEFDIKIKYVHQLQNLYFALTGIELTIKS
jgi:hypothetical protein